MGKILGKFSKFDNRKQEITPSLPLMISLFEYTCMPKGKFMNLVELPVAG